MDAFNQGQKVALENPLVHRMTSATSPHKIKEDLMRRLYLIMMFSQAHEKIIQAKQSGANQEELDKKVAIILQQSSPYKDDPDLNSFTSDLHNLVKPPKPPKEGQ